MGFLSRSIPDQEWVTLAKPIFDLAIGSAAGLSEAIRQDDGRGQVEVVERVVLRFPSLAESLRGSPPPTSAEARRANKNLQLGLKDYIDGAKQFNKLSVDLAHGLSARSKAGGTVGRVALHQIVSGLKLYQGSMKRAEGRLQNARAFLEGTARE